MKFTLGLAGVLACAMAQCLEAPKIDRNFEIAIKAESLTQSNIFKAQRIFKHADYLASDECNGRLAGSPGQAKARQYIIDTLLASGFDEVRQFPFQFTGDVRMGDKNALGFHSKSATEKYEVISDFKPFPISKNGAGSGGLVFAGYGISAPDKGYDDYAGIDAKGKIVVVFRGEPEKPDGARIGSANDPHAAMNSVYGDMFYKAGMARDKGALALLVIDGEKGKAPDKKIQPDLIRGGGRRHCGLPLIQVYNEVAANWFKLAGKDMAELKKSINEKIVPASFTFDDATLDFSADINREKATDWNLAVVLPGTDPVLKDEIIVIGAHYDHLGTGNEFSLADKSEMGKIHRGADDNASGCAAVLEIADALSRNRASLKRTVWIMFFGAEEMGTLGSNDFVNKPPPDFNLKNNAAMLNLDMVGRCRENRVMVYGASTGANFQEVLKRTNQPIGLEIKTTADGFGGSDQTAFNTAGVPVLFFFTGSHEDYHKPSDTADKLNVADEARIAALAFNTAIDLINAPERPKFVKVEAPKMSGGMGGIRLGTLPDYGFDGKGLRLSGVRGGSPADKGGLKGGDIIILFGPYHVENISDYMNAMRQTKPNVVTAITVLRDGKEQEVKVIPERAE